MKDNREDVKKGDNISIQVIARGKILEESEHLTNEDEKGLFVIRKGFKLHLKDVAHNNNIIKH